MLEIILFIVGWLAGLIVASFTLVQSGIIIFFGIPTTRKLTSEGVLKKDNPINKRHLISLAILLTLFAGIICAIYFWLPGAFVGFLVGTGLVLLFSLGKLGANNNNVSDYMETNRRYLTINENPKQ